MFYYHYHNLEHFLISLYCSPLKMILTKILQSHRPPIWVQMWPKICRGFCIASKIFYEVRTIFWHKIWRGIVLHLLHQFKRSNQWERDKVLGFRFLAGQTVIRLRLQNFLHEPMKVAEISGVLFASCSDAPKRGKKCDKFQSLYQTFLNCYFVEISVSFKEKQHHFKFHLTWARDTQFGEGPVLAGHLSESVSPFARNVRPWQHIYSTAQGSNTIVQFVS